MIANPEKAIERATTHKKLAEVLYELLKESYPGSADSRIRALRLGEGRNFQ